MSSLTRVTPLGTVAQMVAPSSAAIHETGVGKRA
jgi:hypothetical protein